MATSILVTQCLQEDFVGLLGARDPLPNKLHIGHREAERLLGPDPERGPLAQLMAWALAQPPERLRVIHVRDWHDPDDPRQRAHLERFGSHCLRGTRGAELVLGLDRRFAERGGARTIDSIALNDFEGTDLADALAEVAGQASASASAEGRGRPPRVAVIGVWTEAKVSFLCYDLLTRGGFEEIATSSALTASASRAQHFNALEQLRSLLGVEVFDGVGALADWLVPGSTGASVGAASGDSGASGASALSTADPAPASLVAGAARFGAKLALEERARPLDPSDLDLLGYLFKDAARVELAELGGGFSGARVFRASAVDALGHALAPAVAKLGPRELIGKERVAFERIEGILGNGAPSVRGFADLGARAGIRYAFASMGRGRVTTLKALYESGAPLAEVERVLDGALDDVLGRLYAAASWERLPLLACYGFSSALAPRVRALVAGVAGEAAASADTLLFPGRLERPNPVGFYERFLAAHRSDEDEHRYVSYVHGDLNAANVLVDGQGNVWVIDFFHAARTHVLKDLAKLENDLLYILTPVGGGEGGGDGSGDGQSGRGSEGQSGRGSEGLSGSDSGGEADAALAEALLITRALAEVESLADPLPERLQGLSREPLVRAWAVIRRLRGYAAALCRDDPDPGQLDVALLRYAVHTLSFDESSAAQKRWALFAAATWAERAERAYARRGRRSGGR